ncbi:MAG: hypothetical protein HYY09_06735 [Firmicutes bacterium]|nr:hypothetical protein [Bacillota bacterium]
MSLILTTVLGGAGIFILPLVDPVVRRRGPAPSVRKVARMALFITVVLAGWDFLTLAPSEFSGYFGLKILVVGGVISAAMVGIGLTLILAGLASSASQVGGLGLYLGAVSALVWILAGRPWFP